MNVMKLCYLIPYGDLELSVVEEECGVCAAEFVVISLREL